MSTYWYNVSHWGLWESNVQPEQHHFMLASQLNLVLLVITVIESLKKVDNSMP
jgi:hypothetical protein